uniref:Uncharacterized protein n=1 Tax=Setaria viridis TaxID=4556 RepID=A0A4V6DC66_SETVI|nr:hypothetical protein SEVIR_2G428650v2 [Setaria viridis]
MAVKDWQAVEKSSVGSHHPSDYPDGKNKARAASGRPVSLVPRGGGKLKVKGVGRRVRAYRLSVSGRLLAVEFSLVEKLAISEAALVDVWGWDGFGRTRTGPVGCGGLGSKSMVISSVVGWPAGCSVRKLAGFHFLVNLGGIGEHPSCLPGLFECGREALCTHDSRANLNFFLLRNSRRITVKSLRSKGTVTELSILVYSAIVIGKNRAIESSQLRRGNKRGKNTPPLFAS